MANKKITELTALTAATSDDLFAIVDDPAGTAATKKITKAAVLSGIPRYDAVVATSGGDYTDIATAITTEGANSVIYIAPGTYTITAAITITQNNVTLIGSGDNTVIIAGVNSIDMFAITTGTDFHISNVFIDGDSPTRTGIRGIHSNAARTIVENCRVEDCISQGILLNDGCDQGIISNCFVRSYSEPIQVSGDNIRVVNNYVLHKGNDVGIWVVGGAGVIVDGNTVDCNGVGPLGMEIGNTVAITGAVISNNTILSPADAGIHVWSTAVTGTNNCLITGNVITGALKHGMWIWQNVFHCVISDNVIKNSSQTTDNTYPDIGLEYDGTKGPKYNLVTNNMIVALNANKSNYAITEESGDYCNYNVITGNKCYGQNASISILGAQSQAYDNTVSTPYMERKMKTMTNTSGGDLAAGDVVTFKAVAAGNEVTTTTTGGDDLVYGIAAEAIVSTASGLIQTLGKTTLLKVDGTTNIAIGDYLSTFTTAKIAKKASAGDTAFAIALEAYIGDDSNGVIDALLVTPRKVGAVV